MVGGKGNVVLSLRFISTFFSGVGVCVCVLDFVLCCLNENDVLPVF